MLDFRQAVGDVKETHLRLASDASAIIRVAGYGVGNTRTMESAAYNGLFYHLVGLG
jgi:hypothetical protein